MKRARIVYSLEAEEQQLNQDRMYSRGETSLSDRLDPPPRIPVLAVPHSDLVQAEEHFWGLKEFNSIHVAKPLFIDTLVPPPSQGKGTGGSSTDLKGKALPSQGKGIGGSSTDIKGKAIAIYQGKEKAHLSYAHALVKNPTGRLAIHGGSIYEGKEKARLSYAHALGKNPTGSLVIQGGSDDKKPPSVSRELPKKPSCRNDLTLDKIRLQRNQPKVIVKADGESLELLTFFKNILQELQIDNKWKSDLSKAVEEQWWGRIDPDFRRIFSDTATTLRKFYKKDLHGGELNILVVKVKNLWRGRLLSVKRVPKLEMQAKIKEDIIKFCQKMKDVLFFIFQDQSLDDETKLGCLKIPSDLKWFLAILSYPSTWETMPHDWLLDNPALYDSPKKAKFMRKLENQLRFSRYAEPFGPVDRVLGDKFYGWWQVTDPGRMTEIKNRMLQERKSMNYRPVDSTSEEKGKPIKGENQSGNTGERKDSSEDKNLEAVADDPFWDWQLPKHVVKKMRQNEKKFDSISEDLAAFFRNMEWHFETPPKTSLKVIKDAIEAADRLLQNINPDYGGICFELHFALGNAWLNPKTREHMSDWDPVMNLLLSDVD